MSKTRSGLVPAKIHKLDKSGNETGDSVVCMFNPFEYTVSKTNQWGKKDNNQSNVPEMQFKTAGSQTLKLSLLFDTYESGEDVSKETRKLWKYMQPTEPSDSPDKKEPPGVAFHWGVFYFKAIIKTMTQKFTLFKSNGTPVRAKVDITFEQHEDVEDYRPQNPTSGGDQILRTWQVTRGDRLDTIAATIYGDATKWPLIAEYNEIDNPLTLQPGQQIIIPQNGRS